ncbi:molybdopterin oxidoreductase family protein [Agarivorans sp. QJM3NY_33]|uniref:molybdopterin oxidoreductase family protein n=1 Tax=Agarivorans sp. QJM3NY_33 TaxID=3421432 RepID=UPI003D7EA816
MRDVEGWIKTTCAYCGVGCGVEARVLASGRLEIRGDQQHPANFGKLCTKGIALGDTVIHDGRLMSPQLKQPDGFVDIDWEHALNRVAEQFSQIIGEHGPDAVAFYVSGQLLTEDYYVANKLIKGFLGTANIDSNSRLCMASAVVGQKRAFGMDTVAVCYQDIEQAELVILVGSNLAWCHPVLFQRLIVAKQNNAALQVIVIDPRNNESCDIADLHLAIAPGSDVVLFNQLLAYLAAQGELDQDFIAQHTQHFEQAYASASSDAQAVHDIGLSEAECQAFFEAFARTERVLTIYSQGVNQSSQGSDKVNSIINCHLATGKIGKPGCGPFSITGQPNAMGGREVGALANTLAAHMEFNPQDIERVASFWQAEHMATEPGLKALDMFEAIAAGKIKALWIMATNPVVSLPDSSKIKRALEKCPFVVVSDCIEKTATTQFADVLLPAQGWSEKSGTVTNSERRISRQRRLLASPGQAKPDWWIISQVAQRMGFKEQFSYAHEGAVFKEHAALTALDNQGFERDLNLAGLSHLSGSEYQQLLPQQWPVLKQQRSVSHQRLFEDGRFYTPNRKANFVAVTYRAPSIQVCADFPLILNTGRTRDHWHTMTRTGLSARLATHMPEPYLLVHPDTAKKYAVTHGLLAKVSNRHGDCMSRVIETTSMRRDEVFVPIHWNELTASNSKPGGLIDARADRLSGQPEFKFTPVKIADCPMSSFALLLVREPVELGQIDYWVRRKTTGAYLYQIESQQSLQGLDERIHLALTTARSRTIQAASANHRLCAAIDNNQLSWLYLAANQGIAEPTMQQVMAWFAEDKPLAELEQDMMALAQ